MKLRQVLVRMGDVYKRSGSYGYMHLNSTGCNKTLLPSAKRGAETEFSIKLVHRGSSDSIWNTSFSYMEADFLNRTT